MIIISEIGTYQMGNMFVIRNPFAYMWKHWILLWYYFELMKSIYGQVQWRSHDYDCVYVRVYLKKQPFSTSHTHTQPKCLWCTYIMRCHFRVIFWNIITNKEGKPQFQSQKWQNLTFSRFDTNHELGVQLYVCVCDMREKEKKDHQP